MLLRDYIKNVLKNIDKGIKGVKFELYLHPNCEVSETVTGNKIKFYVERKK